MRQVLAGHDSAADEVPQQSKTQKRRSRLRKLERTRAAKAAGEDSTLDWIRVGLDSVSQQCHDLNSKIDRVERTLWQQAHYLDRLDHNTQIHHTQMGSLDNKIGTVLRMLTLAWPPKCTPDEYYDQFIRPWENPEVSRQRDETLQLSTQPEEAVSTLGIPSLDAILGQFEPPAARDEHRRRTSVKTGLVAESGGSHQVGASSSSAGAVEVIQGSIRSVSSVSIHQVPQYQAHSDEDHQDQVIQYDSASAAKKCLEGFEDEDDVESWPETIPYDDDEDIRKTWISRNMPVLNVMNVMEQQVLPTTPTASSSSDEAGTSKITARTAARDGLMVTATAAESRMLHGWLTIISQPIVQSVTPVTLPIKFYQESLDDWIVTVGTTFAIVSCAAPLTKLGISTCESCWQHLPRTCWLLPQCKDCCKSLIMDVTNKQYKTKEQNDHRHREASRAAMAWRLLTLDDVASVRVTSKTVYISVMEKILNADVQLREQLEQS